MKIYNLFNFFFIFKKKEFFIIIDIKKKFKLKTIYLSIIKNEKFNQMSFKIKINF